MVRDLTNFNRVSEQAVENPSGLARALPQIANAIVTQNQEAKLLENTSKAQLELSRLSQEYKIKNEGNPFDETAAREFSEQRKAILDGLGQDIIPQFQQAWTRQSLKLEGINDSNLQSWQFKQARVNATNSLKASYVNFIDKAGFDGQKLATGEITPIDFMADLNTAYTELQDFGAKNLGEATTEASLQTFRSDYAAAAIEGVAMDSPFKAKKLLETDSIKSEMDFEDYAKLTRGVDQMIKQRQAQAAQAKFMEQILEGQRLADPANKVDRKIVDKQFVDSGLLQGLLSGDETSRMETESLIRSTSIIPESLQSTMRGFMLNGDDTQRQFAYSMVGRIGEISPRSLVGPGGFSQKEIDDAQAYNSMTRAGASTEYAIQQIDAASDPIEAPVRNLRESQVNTLISDLTPSQVTDLFDESYWSSDPSFMNKRNEDAIFADYKALYREAFLRYGNDDAAKGAAISQLKTFNGVTNVTGNKALMQLPPERFYSVEQMTPEENTQWMRQEFESDLKGFGVDPEGATLVASFDSKNRVNNGGKPVYHVIQEREDENGYPIIDLVRGENNEPAIFAFDTDAAQKRWSEKEQARLQLRREQAAAINEKRAERAEQQRILDEYVGDPFMQGAFELKNWAQDQVIKYQVEAEQPLSEEDMMLIEELRRQQGNPAIPGGF